MTQFSIIQAPCPDGTTKSKIQGGLDVREYVFIAQGYHWDVVRTAAHLSKPEEEVRFALDHYRRDPREVDQHLREMDEMWAHIDEVAPGILRLPMPK